MGATKSARFTSTVAAHIRPDPDARQWWMAARQRIGRGLRAKKNGPNVAFVVDFTECNNQTLRDHQKERMQIIMGTPGFAENVVDDFDYPH